MNFILCFLLFSFVNAYEEPRQLRRLNEEYCCPVIAADDSSCSSSDNINDAVPACNPYRSTDTCADDESFAKLVKARTTHVSRNLVQMKAAGHWFHELESKVAGYLLSNSMGLPVPEILCCVNSPSDLSTCTNISSSSAGGIVVKATDLHSNDGVFVLPNGYGGKEILRGLDVVTLADIVDELSAMGVKGKIVVEEFVRGGSSTTSESLLPTEYKYHMFGSDVAAISVIENRGTPCACYAVVDEDFNRLDQYGCFAPDATLSTPAGSCPTINFLKGKRSCGPVKRDLPLCSSIPEPPFCIREDMKAIAQQLSTTVGVYSRIDMFLGTDGVYFQEFATNHMNGIRHCMAKMENDGCINSCFMGQLWKSFSSSQGTDGGGSLLYGGVATTTPEIISDWQIASNSNQECQILKENPLSVTFRSKCSGPIPESLIRTESPTVLPSLMPSTTASMAPSSSPISEIPSSRHSLSTEATDSPSGSPVALGRSSPADATKTESASPISPTVRGVTEYPTKSPTTSLDESSSMPSSSSQTTKSPTTNVPSVVPTKNNSTPVMTDSRTKVPTSTTGTTTTEIPSFSTMMPSAQPTKAPTIAATESPSSSNPLVQANTKSPSTTPATESPFSSIPTTQPTQAKSLTDTEIPTEGPSEQPSKVPFYGATESPSTINPLVQITKSPTTPATDSPSTMIPSVQPTKAPTLADTEIPTETPSHQPSKVPISGATESPSTTRTTTTTPATESPSTTIPSTQPTKAPTTEAPSNQLSAAPSPGATTDSPSTIHPTKAPTIAPTENPTKLPSNQPTGSPTGKASNSPSKMPSLDPTKSPTAVPTRSPVSPRPTASPANFNCEELHQNLQVRWAVEGNYLSMELIGKIGSNDYMAFGRSGDDDRTYMTGTDAVVADFFNGQARAVDFFMNARRPCNPDTLTGVCPDTVAGFVNDVTEVSGERSNDGITVIRYVRPLVPTDVGVEQGGVKGDRPISVEPGVQTYVSWGLGSLRADGLPSFHSLGYPDRDYVIEFGRSPVDNCGIIGATPPPSPNPTGSPVTSAPTEVPTAGPTGSPVDLGTSPPTTAPSPVNSIVECSDSGDVSIPQGLTTLQVQTSGICLLLLQEEDGSMKSVGRSFDGGNWEASAGDFATLQFTCASTTCDVTLPPLATGEEYHLVFLDDPTLTADEEIARFFEQATFGASSSDIQGIGRRRLLGVDVSLLGTFASWMEEQMDPTLTPPSSHREFYRQRLNSRFELPSEMGVVTHPCEKGTKYRLYAFTFKDADSNIQLETKEGKRLVKVNGELRTVVYSVATISGDEFPDGTFRVCRRNWLPFLNQKSNTPKNSRFSLEWNGCQDVAFDGVYGNTPILFDQGIEGAYPENIIDLQGAEAAVANDMAYYEFYGYTPSVQEFILTKDIYNEYPACTTFGVTGNPEKMVFAQFNGKFWIHDPRFTLKDNTVGNPLIDGGGAMVDVTQGNYKKEMTVLCSAAPRTFVNEEGCVISSDKDVCGAHQVGDVMVELSFANLKKIYDVTGGHNATGTRYLYAIDNLEINSRNPAPCKSLATSRWVKNVCDGTGPTVESKTKESLAFHLSNSEDKNVYVRDIFMPSSGTVCDGLDRKKQGIEITLQNGECWKNVHPQHLQVFDMTYWTLRTTHPGNMVSDREPIKEFAWEDSHTLFYPRSTHPMERWEDNQKHFDNIGRLGDEVPINGFPETLLTDEVAEAFDAINVARGTSTVVCGTPGEVKNDLMLAGDTLRGAFDAQTRWNRTSADTWLVDQRKQVWTTIALQGKDQLRQRMAWALSQILVVSADAIGDSKRNTEWFLAYYDIFVRHAFGNYKDILMEVSYSPMMGEMLTYLDSKSTSYVWEKSQGAELGFPDENMAREVMQLFSTGLYKMEQNGNRIIENGDFARVYLNDDIEEYSRMWTGFRRQSVRGNVERMSNRIDPMYIEPAWRDQFPKMGLEGVYVGDRYPLCGDLPEKHFLSRGAKYRRVRSTGQPELHVDPSKWGTTENPVRFRAASNSDLSNALCSKNEAGVCQYPINVVLDKDLACLGDECIINTIRTIEVETGVFYEYVRRPCVEQAFYPNAKRVVGKKHDSVSICADPRTEAATPACCLSSCCSTMEKFGYETFRAESPEKYWGERTTFDGALKRCEAICEHPDLTLFCGSPYKKSDNSCSTIETAPTRFWTSAPCQLMAKIDPSDGTVAIVHKVDNVPTNKMAKQVQEDTKTFFRVHWKKDGLRVPDLGEILRDLETNEECTPVADGGLLCPVAVEEIAVYSDAYRPGSVKDVMSELWIGSVPPSKDMTTSTSNGVTFHNPNTKSASDIFADSIFEVVDEFGRTHFLQNKKSVVTISGTTLSFRNPPHFIGLSDREPRDMHHETEATIDHYLYHSNTAPFLALRFAQRFGNSNPTPTYIAAIANAFRTGKYVAGATTFGKGVYGDLGATLAAVLLETEARAPVLDFDFAHGSLREPLLKVIGLMRALDFQPAKNRPIVSFKADMLEFIGQQAHELPSVFSFFLPEFKLAGSRASTAGLVTPEAGVLTTPKMVQTMNGLFSMLRYGLDECYGGFGDGGSSTWCNTKRNYGHLQYQPSSSDAQSIIDELATLLTAGRLSTEGREIARQLYEQTSNKDDALVLVQQLITSSAEFHSTGRVIRSDESRPIAPKPPPSTMAYKGIVVIILSGGYDSWNMLVPHVCTGTNDEGVNIRQQYESERGTLAFIESERTETIVINDTKYQTAENNNKQQQQPCSEFVVHDELKIVKELYDDDDLAFFANMGVLNQPVTKKDYNQKTKTQLFAHNTMQRESKRIDPYNTMQNTGVLGRAMDVLQKRKKFRSNGLAVDNPSVAVRGTPGKSPDSIIVSRKGPTAFNPGATAGSPWDIAQYIVDINNATKSTSSVYGEVWSHGFLDAVEESGALKSMLDAADFKVPLPDSPDSWDETMGMVSKLIQTQGARGVDRDVIHATLGGWDHHSKMKMNLRTNFVKLNRVLTHFVAEMKAIGKWDDVTLVVTSDFARTMVPNSGDGSDHAWGGHYFMMGGKVKGGQIHGQYPFDITANGPLNIGRGRGRMIPSLSWESMWNGVMKWFGVEDETDLDHVMPNRKGTGSMLFSDEDLFEKSD